MKKGVEKMLFVDVLELNVELLVWKFIEKFWYNHSIEFNSKSYKWKLLNFLNGLNFDVWTFIWMNHVQRNNKENSENRSLDGKYAFEAAPHTVQASSC